jgi:hypothetical protein
MIPASAKKRKKKSKSQTVREKCQKEEQAQHQLADMLHANVEQTDHCPCNGGELFFIQPTTPAKTPRAKVTTRAAMTEVTADRLRWNNLLLFLCLRTNEEEHRNSFMHLN